MKKTNMTHRILMGALLCITVVSCETTGDPHQGGYLGWSSQKAVARQTGLRSELTGLNETGANLSAEQRSIENEIASLNERLRQAQARQDREAIARVENEIKSKQARLAALNETL